MQTIRGYYNNPKNIAVCYEKARKKRGRIYLRPLNFYAVIEDVVCQG